MSKTLEQKIQEYSDKTVYSGSERALSKQTLTEYCQSDFRAGYIECKKEYEEKLENIKIEIKDTIDYLRDFQNEHKKANSKSQVIAYETCLSHFEDILSSFL